MRTSWKTLNSKEFDACCAYNMIQRNSDSAYVMNLNILPRLSLSSFTSSSSPHTGTDTGLARPQLKNEGNNVQQTSLRDLSDESMTASLASSTLPLCRTSSSPCSPATKHVRKRVGLDEEILRKNRKIVDSYLRRVGSQVDGLNNKSLTLNSEGVCYFPFRKFVVVVEVPEDNVNVCFLYTMVCRLDRRVDNALAVMHHALQLNYLLSGTRGATIGVSGEEVNLCRTFPISTTNALDMVQLVNDFLAAAVNINRQLESVRKGSSRSSSPHGSTSEKALSTSNKNGKGQRHADRIRAFTYPE
jgi:hypothetical protein